MSPIIRISNDKDEIDGDLVFDFLRGSKWARGLPRQVFDRAIENSLCFSLICDGLDARQLGFARVITDKATFAYLADVFVVPESRGQGLSHKLMRSVVEHPELQGLRRFMLSTSDAHGIYERYGFQLIVDNAVIMQVHNPEVYER